MQFICYLVIRFPEKIGGNLDGVHYIRDVADADALVSSLVNLHPSDMTYCSNDFFDIYVKNGKLFAVLTIFDILLF